MIIASLPRGFTFFLICLEMTIFSHAKFTENAVKILYKKERKNRIMKIIQIKITLENVTKAYRKTQKSHTYPNNFSDRPSDRPKREHQRANKW